MPKELSYKTCVRVISGTLQGSGVLLASETNCCVLTALHCIEKRSPLSEGVKIEIQREGYTSRFEEIPIIEVVDYNEENDWVLFKVELDYHSVVSQCHKGTGFILDESVFFCGYQQMYKDQYRPFQGKVTLLSDDKFQITLLNDTFQYGGEDGQFLAQGLSGSGVYIIRNNKLYLIGILNSVKSENAWHDDIYCCPITCLGNNITDIQDLSGIELLKQWEDNIEKDMPDIDKYKALNVGFFENLARKNKVIYETEEDANRNTSRQLLEYLSLKEKFNTLNRDYPEIYTRITNIITQFQCNVKEDYSRSVSDNNDAKDIKIKLTENLRVELETILPQTIKIDLANYQVIEWLLDCSFNLTKRAYDRY